MGKEGVRDGTGCVAAAHKEECRRVTAARVVVGWESGAGECIASVRRRMLEGTVNK